MMLVYRVTADWASPPLSLLTRQVNAYQRPH
jgi:hypothetical protein